MFCGDPDPLDRAHLDGHEENSEPSNLGHSCRACNVVCGNVLRAANLGRTTNQFNPAGARSAGHYAQCVGAMLGRDRSISLPSAIQTLQNTPHKKRAEFVKSLRNPGAANLAAYMEAVTNHKRGAHDAGGKIIHATPKAKRQEFAAQIADTKRARYGSSGGALPDWVMNAGIRANAGRRKNPGEAAAAVFEGFHGYPSQEMILIQREHRYHSHVAGVGELVLLFVVPLFEEKEEGVVDRCIKLSRFEALDGPAQLTVNSQRNQLYIDGGDQSIDVDAFKLGPAADHEQLVIGKGVQVGYYTDKTHLGKEGGKAVYLHTFGEYRDENGRRKFKGKAARPFITYDRLNQTLGFYGGDYTIPDEGISE